MSVRVVVLGNINQDFVMRTEQMPRPGETVSGTDLRLVAGGKGANQAVTAARLGAEVTLLGRVGQDAFGPGLVENLRREGVETRYIGTDDQTATGAAFISLTPDGQNSIISVGGANLQYLPRLIKDAIPVIQQAQVALVQYAVPLASIELLVEVATAAGVPVVMDPTPAVQQLPKNWQSCTALTPNETEVEALVGYPAPDLPTAARAARDLHARGVAIALVKRGAEGCVVCDGEGVRLVGGWPVEVVDTTGAGDAFAAGFAVALTEGMGVTPAVAFGNACGALACTRFGAQPSLPTRRQAEQFITARGGLAAAPLTPL